MGRTPPQERLARLLKQSSSIPEVRAFRQQVRDIYSMGGPLGVDNWIEARRDLGLITDPLVERAATDLQSALGRVIDQAMEKAPSKPTLTWEQRVPLNNERETKRRQNVAPVGIDHPRIESPSRNQGCSGKDRYRPPHRRNPSVCHCSSGWLLLGTGFPKNNAMDEAGLNGSGAPPLS